MTKACKQEYLKKKKIESNCKQKYFWTFLNSYLIILTSFILLRPPLTLNPFRLTYNFKIWKKSFIFNYKKKLDLKFPQHWVLKFKNPFRKFVLLETYFLAGNACLLQTATERKPFSEFPLHLTFICMLIYVYIHM